MVLLFNFGENDFEVKPGDRIAQFIVEKYTETEAVEVDNLDDTERGDGGFGSTGVGKH
jgi:dUTP pyrophosphatase